MFWGGKLLRFNLSRHKLADGAMSVKLGLVVDRYYKRHPERLEHLRKLAREARDDDIRNGVPPPDFKEILRLMKLARNAPPGDPS